MATLQAAQRRAAIAASRRRARAVPRELTVEPCPESRCWYRDGKPTPEWVRLRSSIIQRNGYQCRRCRERAPAAVPYDPRNLIALCHRCHGAAEADTDARGALSWDALTTR